jgi:hypothetical protein
MDNLLKQQHLQKQQERLDNALFVLTEEEQKSLSQGDLLKRLEEVLAMEEALEAAEQLEPQQHLDKDPDNTDTPQMDWLQTRRTALNRSMHGQQDGDFDDDDQIDIIPVIHHQLLTVDEIQTLLESLGGKDIVVLPDDPEQPRMGGAMGMIICTAESEASAFVASYNPFLANAITRGLIDHLKHRQLQDLGVLGAQMGTGHLSTRQRGTMTNTGTSTWHVVDCGNYIVHVMDEVTRRALKLEYLWSGKDPLWKLDYWDESAMDEYCERHPVPNEYNGGVVSSSSSAATTFWDSSMVRRLERSQYAMSVPRHRPVVANAIKRRDRRAGRKQKREQWQKQSQQRRQF